MGEWTESGVSPTGLRDTIRLDIEGKGGDDRQGRIVIARSDSYAMSWTLAKNCVTSWGRLSTGTDSVCALDVGEYSLKTSPRFPYCNVKSSRLKSEIYWLRDRCILRFTAVSLVEKVLSLLPV